MAKKLRGSEAALQPIRDTSSALARLDPVQVQRALGAEALDEELPGGLAPVTLFAVRDELVRRLHSSGGRPALTGTTRRAKIPLSEKEWEKLEELAAAIGTPGFAPSAGQVASVLLSLSLDSVAARVGDDAASSPIARELRRQIKSMP